MGARTLLPAVALAWGAIGVLIALGAGGVPLPWMVAAIAGPALALLAARAARRDRVRLFGLLLTLSAVVTPTYFAAFLALVPLTIGLTNLVLGGLSPPRRLRWTTANE